MASGDAYPVPQKNVAFRLTFCLRLNTGSVNSGAAGLDSEVSKDGAAFADCTNEATEITGGNGVYYLDLTQAEMNANTVAVVVKSSTTNAVTYDAMLFPQEAGDIKVDVQSINTSTKAAIQQGALADSAEAGTVDSATYAPTTVDFETSFTTNNPTDYYKGRSIVFTVGGALKDQVARITGSTYTGNNKTKLTVTALTGAPANGQNFCLC